MKVSIALTTTLVVGGAAAQSTKFKLPSCAKSCLSYAATCDNSADFCSSSCFGPCLTSGCSDAYQQQQLIRACRAPFADAVSGSTLSSPTSTRRPETRPALTTTTRSTAEPSETPFNDDLETASSSRSAALAAAASRTAGLDLTHTNSTSSNTTEEEEKKDEEGGAMPALSRSLAVCSIVAVAGVVVLFV